MKITKADFDQWRGGAVTEYIFDTLMKEHAEKIKRHFQEGAWSGNLDTDYWTSCKAEYKVFTQLVALKFEDLEALSEDEQDNDE